MKIAILSRYQGKVNRGVEAIVSELSTRLLKKHDVDIFQGKNSDNLGLLLKNKYDVVMPMNGRWQSFKASLGRRTAGYKLVICGHSGIGRDDIWNIAICKPDIFIALTDFMANWARKWAWGSKVVKIPNGIDLNKFKPKGKKYIHNLSAPTILSVGALAWYKYHERTINAVAKIGNGSLLIVGDGPEKRKLEKLGEEKLGNRFKIISLDYEKMPELYRSADIFTLPSWDREAFGVVYLEAMASGLAVVAPDDPPRQEIVGGAGKLINVEDTNIFADALTEVLKKDWGDLPRKQAEKFSWDIIAKEYEDCLENL